jgi:hypothetical protein
MPLLFILVLVPILLPLTGLWAMVPPGGSALRSRPFWVGLSVIILALALAGLVDSTMPGAHWGIFEASKGLVFVVFFSSASLYAAALTILCVIAVWARLNIRTAKGTNIIKRYSLAAQVLGFVVCVGVAVGLFLLITGPPPVSS